MQHAIPKKAANTPALIAIGAKATAATRMRALVGLGVVLYSRLRIDEKVWDQGDKNQDEWAKYFAEEDTGEVGSGDIARQFLRGGTKDLALETSDASSRQPAEGDPAGRMRSRIAARKPAQEVAIINEEIVPGKLVRVEKEWRNTQGK